jgi:hypothetical protein
MKTILTSIILLASINLFALEAPRINSVTTADGQVYSLNKLHYGISNYLVGTTLDGEKVTFKYSEITRFYKNGVLYEKINTNKIETCKNGSFLPVAKRKHDVVAYKQEVMNARGQIKSVLHVFVNGEYALSSNDQNMEQIESFFAGK